MSDAALLDPSRVACGRSAESRKSALETLSELLAGDQTRVTSADVHRLLYEREKLGSTCIGQGVALPHARHPEVAEPVAALLLLSGPVEFQPGEKGTVQVVAGLLQPEQGGELELAALHTILSDPDRIAELLQVTEPAKAAALVNEWLRQSGTESADLSEPSTGTRG